ncbi:UDP-glucose 4-epimerase GalE [Bacillus massilinigeriensis]|uniref:UDP-glucose 4-epimerase GalE n=1 Tax=Bacillus massilionigeriensis TaxID=1805475 RepID=UPI00096B5FD4|nr:UDP-glucose 4-epimerase GalE [Bacillus massilionigeriensis]
MAILVTGGAGYIGSHTCVELLNAGYELVIVDNLLNSSSEAIRRVKNLTRRHFLFYQIDMLEEDQLEKVFVENEIEACIHFAGLKAVGESVTNPLLYYRNNLMSTIVLCQIMKKYGVKNLVFSSSATVYGSPERMPILEDFSLKAMNPYGRSKLFIEEILQDLYFSHSEWSITLLRYFNPIGAHMSGQIGESTRGIPNNLMPYITNVALGKYPELFIFGNNYPTRDGTCVRDYIHVVDLAIGHIKALEKNMIQTGVHTYNLGTGRGYSVLELVSTFEDTTGNKIPYQFSKPRPGDVAICYADPTRAEQEIGWKAGKTLEEMCIDSWRWQLNNPNGYLA